MYPCPKLRPRHPGVHGLSTAARTALARRCGPDYKVRVGVSTSPDALNQFAVMDLMDQAGKWCPDPRHAEEMCSGGGGSHVTRGRQGADTLMRCLVLLRHAVASCCCVVLLRRAVVSPH